MKKIYLAAFLFGLSLVNAACENYDDDHIYPAEYHKILYLKTSGEVDLSLYKTGEDTNYSLTVIKAGTEANTTANVKVNEMTQAELDEYCSSRGLDYKALPPTCFSFDTNVLDFTSSDPYKKVNVTFNTNQIEEVLKSNTGNSKYVLPVIVTSDNDSISSTMNMIIVKPSVVVPSVAFKETGYISHTSAKTGTTLEVPITLQIDNQWDFTCKVAIDESLLEGTTYIPMPKDAYQLENDGVVNFVKGSNTATLKIKVNELQHADNVIPLSINSISLETFGIDKTPLLLGVTINQYPLTVNMLSTNALEPSEGSLANLLDNDVTTYFHSAWSVSVEGEHYVQVTLPEAISSFKFSYTNRQANGNAALGAFGVSISSDGQNFTLLKEFSSDADKLPGGGAGVYDSPVLENDTPFTAIRFTCHKNMTEGAFFVWSEFSLFGL